MILVRPNDQVSTTSKVSIKHPPTAIPHLLLTVTAGTIYHLFADEKMMCRASMTSTGLNFKIS